MYFVGGPGPELYLNMGIPGPLNRIVLFYNVYTTLQITISYYIILLYNTLLHTVRIQIHYCFQDVPTVAATSIFCTTIMCQVFRRGFPLKKDQRTAKLPV